MTTVIPGRLKRSRSLLARDYTADELVDTMDEQGMDTDLDDTMIRLVYYNYHAGKDKISLTLPQLVTFLKDEVLEDETFGADAGEDVRAHIDDMEKFTDKEQLTRKMSA